MLQSLTQDGLWQPTNAVREHSLVCKIWSTVSRLPAGKRTHSLHSTKYVVAQELM